MCAHAQHISMQSTNRVICATRFSCFTFSCLCVVPLCAALCGALCGALCLTYGLVNVKSQNLCVDSCDVYAVSGDVESEECTGFLDARDQGFSTSESVLNVKALEGSFNRLIGVDHAWWLLDH